jgi:CopG antitoxin of type II toxin-antitoxin system
MGHNSKMVEKAKKSTSSKLKIIPKFKSEEEERYFWETHDTTKYFDSNKMTRVKFPNKRLVKTRAGKAAKDAILGKK